MFAYIILIMKIWGIGVDLVQNSRISNVLDKSHARRFLTRVLHPEELSLFDTIKPHRIQVQFVASRWAVKEAAVKAVGRRELVFSELKIIKDEHGTSAIM